MNKIKILFSFYKEILIVTMVIFFVLIYITKTSALDLLVEERAKNIEIVAILTNQESQIRTEKERAIWYWRCIDINIQRLTNKSNEKLEDCNVDIERFAVYNQSSPLK